MYKKAKSKDKYCGVKKNSNLYVACFMGWQFEKKLTWPQKSQRCNLSFFFLFFFFAFNPGIPHEGCLQPTELFCSVPICYTSTRLKIIGSHCKKEKTSP
jgi:hypothetical protein